MKKVLFVSTIFPFPVDNGKKVVISGLVKYFAERYGKSNVEYIVIGDEISKESLKYFNKVYKLGKPPFMVKLKNVAWNSFIKRNKSIQESMIFSKSVQRRLHQLIINSHADIVIYDTLRIGQFFETYNYRNGVEFLYLDDLFSVRYEKMLEIIDKYPGVKLNALGNYKKFVPSVFHSFVNISLIQSWLLVIERKLIKKRENGAILFFENNLLINKDEVIELQKRTSQKNVMEVKPFLGIEQATSNRIYNKSKPHFVFMGALNIPHNNVSITRFIKTEIENIVKILPDFKLIIIGKNPSAELIDLSKKYEEYIEIKGYVKNLDDIFNKACAMIIPLIFGSGVKLKTLEAMAKGLPVIATDFGVEGIPVSQGVNCLVENNFENYPIIMSELCNVQKNAEISKEAIKFFNDHYRKEVIFKHYDKIFQ